MEIPISQSWETFLHDYLETEAFKRLTAFIDESYKTSTIYPPQSLIFSAFDSITPKEVKVIILGQDPYHNEGQAHGLAFSVAHNQKLPPSLRNIYKELHNDAGVQPRESGNLRHWAKQGVLLLNTTLTVEKGKPGSHQKAGWEECTDFVIEKLSMESMHLVFMLWGNHAKKKGGKIDRSKHLVLEAPHPSPFSVHKGFFGCKHFSKTNAYLREYGRKEIDW